LVYLQPNAWLHRCVPKQDLAPLVNYMFTNTVCSTNPMTGWRRTGRCDTDEADTGSHVVCARVTPEFLAFTKSRGNDLVTPRSNFPGLKPGDKWCLCALRWKEALQAGVAPPVDLKATSVKALKYVSIDDLKRHAL
jgi:uncharacterized protein (DUF2237 family)